MHELETLPEEVWREIINNAPTCTDIVRVYNKCPVWRAFLEQDRVKWMFSGAFPSFAKYLSKSDFLATAQVCKSWNQAAKTYLEKHPSFFQLPVQPSYIMPTESMESEKNGDQFCVLTPPPTLSVQLKVGPWNMNAQGLERFEKYGEHVSSVELLFVQRNYWEVPSQLQMTWFVWKILNFVPNLEILVLATFGNNFQHELMQDYREAQQIERFLEKNLFPNLPRLTDMQLEINNDLLRQTLETLYCPQLTKYAYATNQKYVPNNLTNLTDAAWSFLDGYTVEQLYGLKHLFCPRLRRLHISVIKYYEIYGYDYRTPLLFKAIESFKDSLTHLSLFWNHFDGSLPRQLDLPFLEELCIEIQSLISAECINFSFLGTLHSLRKLKCVFGAESYRQLSLPQNCYSKRETVDLHRYLNKKVHEGPYKSNIWRLLPSLDGIEIQVVGNTVSTRIYTRSYMNRNGLF